MERTQTTERGAGRFEDRLLSDLRTMVAERPASAGAARAPRAGGWLASPPRRRPVLAGGLAVAAVVAAGTGLVLVSGGSTPAYAVEANGDGTVTVEISSLQDAAGLERELRAEGIPAVVRYLEPGTMCKAPWFTPAAPPADGSGPQEVRGGVQVTPDGHARFTISRDLPAGTTLVVATQGSGAGAGPTGIQVAMASGTVNPCTVVPATGEDGLAPPPPGATTRRVERGTSSSGG